MAGGSILDELVSWQRLKAPLQRYLDFVRCNYFGDADDDQSTDASQRLEDGSSVDRETSADDQLDDSADAAGAAPVTGKTSRQDDEARLLHRPREERRLTTSSRHSLSSDHQH